MKIELQFGLLFCLTFVLAGLKLCEFIDCSWLWVFAPLWLPFAMLVGAFSLLLALILTAMGVAAILAMFGRT